MLKIDGRLFEEAEDLESGGGAVATEPEPEKQEDSDRTHWESVIDEAAESYERPSEPETPEQPRDTQGRYAEKQKEPEAPAEPAEPAEQPEEAPTETADAPGDDLKQLAASYGLNEQQIAQYPTAESLEKALLQADWYLANEGYRSVQEWKHAQQSRQSEQQAQPQPQPQPQPDPQPQQAQPQQAPTQEQQQDLAAHIKRLEDAGYDEEVIEPLKALYQQNEFLRGQVEQIGGYLNHQQELAYQQQQAAYEQAQQAEQRQFIEFMDGLGAGELFGAADKQATPEQQQNTRNLWATLDVLRHGLAAKGFDASMSKPIVERAYRLAFSNQIQHRTQTAKTRAVQAQSQRRMGQGSKAKGRPDVPWDGEPGEDPVIKDFFRKKREEGLIT